MLENDKHPDFTALYGAGLGYPGVNVHLSEAAPLLITLANYHADLMAKFERQDHHNFQQRFDEILRELKLYATEICAESWVRQKNDCLYDLAKEMYHCWEQSYGHWKVASTPHKVWGGAMKQGANGVWYACIIVADENINKE